MFATAITLAVIGFAIRGLFDLAQQDGAKMLAAFRGQSWAAEVRPERPMVVRFSSQPETVWPVELRAAA